MSFRLPYICNLKYISVLVRMPDATSLHHYLKNKQIKLNAFSSKDSAKGVFNIMHTVDNTCIRLTMQLEKYYTYCIERRWHIPYNLASARLATGL